MAGQTDTPSTADIWHLTIDDLLAPLPETIRLGGAGPFVINLSASSAPIVPPVKGVAHGDQAHLYQLQRTEDRRVRYRLRLGPFASEDEADAVLRKVRDDYPGALTATADTDDLRAIAALTSKSPAAQTTGPLSLPRSAVPPASAAPRAVTAPASQSVAASPASSDAPVTADVPMLTAVRVLPVPAAAPKPADTPAAPVAPVRAPAAAIPVLRAPATATPAPRAAAAATAAPSAPIAAIPAPRGLAAASPPSAPVARRAEPARPVPTLESTQTVRALTQLELEDDQASRWFAIQLALAEEAFDPETVPNLDIFRVYRLYSVAGIDQGRIVHALRLGFFTEQVAAGAVASYLAAFYDTPAVKRVSTAERERFAEQSLEPRKDVGATGKQAVIEITNERYIREKRIGQAAGK